MAELIYQFSTSTAFTSKVIRVLTHSRFSHIDMVLPDEGLLGASGPDKKINDPGGLIVRPFNCWPYLNEPKIARVQCSDAVKKRTIEWLRTPPVYGAPFDNAALYHFLRDRMGLPPVGRNWRDPAKWYCAECQLRAPELGGLFDYPLITEKDVVSPNDLLIFFNPFMSVSNIEEFTECDQPNVMKSTGEDKMNRRMFNTTVTMGALVGLTGLGACTNGQLDPQKVIDGLKEACGIIVPAATILQVFNLDKTQTVKTIVNLLCSGYEATVATQQKLGKPLAANEAVEYDVVVNGQKVHVVATHK